ncbi:hypothetical protein BD626DRAFT_538450 [Schizophyllum amplum]|uniref:Uncharacterized protein n=1 Tax=Schizophyllum amplum TaxID=97359 RepID=A0A550C7X4_9AGAR|nr:hypothetical protein BD626DRAFT_538450 [Auriculariopsis ampla]
MEEGKDIDPMARPADEDDHMNVDVEVDQPTASASHGRVDDESHGDEGTRLVEAGMRSIDGDKNDNSDEDDGCDGRDGDGQDGNNSAGSTDQGRASESNGHESEGVADHAPTREPGDSGDTSRVKSLGARSPVTVSHEKPLVTTGEDCLTAESTQARATSSQGAASTGDIEAENSRVDQDSASSEDAAWSSRASWPAWLENAVTNVETLTSANMDAAVEKRWTHLVQLWFRLEHASEFRRHTTLGSKKRPTYIGAWIARARSVKYLPPRPSGSAEVSEWISDFQDGMWAWWYEVNPSWRKGNTGNRLLKPKVSGDWAPLHHTRPNGLLSVLKGLKWLFEMENVRKGSKKWCTLMDDVEYAFENLLEQFGSSSDDEPPRKRQRLGLRVYKDY